MEAFVLVCLIAILLVRWVYLRDRLNEMDDRIRALAAAVAASAPAPAATTWRDLAPEVPLVTPPPPPPPPPAQAPAPAAPVFVPALAPEPPALVESVATTLDAPATSGRASEAPRFTAAPPAPSRSTADWEALLGGNWLNKLGVFVLVIGIALALAYSYKLLGPAGRVAVSLAISSAMLVAGVLTERRERYRIFGQGLLGGGWAALYFTVYAMQSLDAARIIDSPWLGGFLLLGVAVGMIVHSLHYRSQTVTGLAYFIAFSTLAITHVTALSLAALVPLAASLLYIARRFGWSRMALFGLIATYAVCATRPDNGAPLWQAQTIFTVYWLLFEAFDILSADPWLLPLNALGFLGLSIFKWQSDASHEVWQLLAGCAAAYLLGALLRARSGRWQVPITLTAALGAVALFLKLDHQWIALGLLVEAELFYLAGVRLNAEYLRLLGASLFGVEVAQLVSSEVGQVAVRSWTPIGALSAGIFYLNRALRSRDLAYGFAGAGMLALVAGFESPEKFRAMVWLLLALAPFAVGWWRRLADFRLQAYLLTLVGLAGAAVDLSTLSLSVAAGVTYGMTLWSLLAGEDEFVQIPGSIATTLALAGLLWRIVPYQYLGVSMMLLALVLLELGLRGMPKFFRTQAYLLAAAGVLLNHGPWWGVALAAYAMAARARKEQGGAVLAVASFVGTGYAMASMWELLPPYGVAPAWAVLAMILAEFDVPVLRVQTHLASLAAATAALTTNLHAPYRLPAVGWVLASHYYLGWRTRERFYLYSGAALAAVLMHYELANAYAPAGWAVFGLALLLAGRYWKLVDLGWQSYAMMAMAFARCWYTELDGVWVVIPCLYAAQLSSRRDSRTRLYYALLANTLTSLVPYYKMAAAARTVAWGVEGMLLLGAGFPLRDRVLRLSGLALLLGCIAKLFFWDLRNLETFPRIISFIVLGLFLVGVSWVYTRFRERVSQYL